jgi:hypothetical protein
MGPQAVTDIAQAIWIQAGALGLLLLGAALAIVRLWHLVLRLLGEQREDRTAYLQTMGEHARSLGAIHESLNRIIGRQDEQAKALTSLYRVVVKSRPVARGRRATESEE